MKKKLIIIIFGIILLILLSIIFVFHNNYPKIKTREDALILGEEKLSLFLHLVDGQGKITEETLTSTKEISINNHISLTKEKLEKKFVCSYEKEEQRYYSNCYAKNLEKYFKKLFVSDITYDEVFGINNYLLENDKYYLNYTHICSDTPSMKNFSLEVKEIKDDKITYIFKYDLVSLGVYSKNYSNDFVLVKENREWKISKVSYSIPCEKEININ